MTGEILQQAYDKDWIRVAKEARSELESMDWLGEYGTYSIASTADNRIDEAQIIYKDQWGREWIVFVFYADDKWQIIINTDLGLYVDLCPASYWAYLAVAAMSIVKELDK